MTFYEPNPGVWAPEDDPRIFVVLVPNGETSISLPRYRELLCRRLEWLIDVWMDEAEESSLEETHAVLKKRTREFAIYHRIPRLPRIPHTPAAVQEWKTAWARFLVMESDIMNMRLQFLPVSFPVQVETDPAEIESLLRMFLTPDVQPHLEEWLIETIDPMLR